MVVKHSLGQPYMPKKLNVLLLRLAKEIKHEDQLCTSNSRVIVSIIYYTSSTAQGGGGSVKNRKPIGAVGCCESPMAERSH